MFRMKQSLEKSNPTISDAKSHGELISGIYSMIFQRNHRLFELFCLKHRCIFMNFWVFTWYSIENLYKSLLNMSWTPLSGDGPYAAQTSDRHRPARYQIIGWGIWSQECIFAAVNIHMDGITQRNLKFLLFSLIYRRGLSLRNRSQTGFKGDFALWSTAGDTCSKFDFEIIR